jgi:hypothetical protein
MHPRIAELLDYVQRQNRVLRAAYDAVPDARKNRRPAPERWSAAEVVRHVTLVNQSLIRALARLVEQAAALPRETETGRVIMTIDVARMIDRTRKFVAADSAQPRDTDPARVWTDFDDTARDLSQTIVGADGLAMGAVSADHPYLGMFSGYEWIVFAGAHAARHAEQIRESERAAMARA